MTTDFESTTRTDPGRKQEANVARGRGGPHHIGLFRLRLANSDCHDGQKGKAKNLEAQRPCSVYRHRQGHDDETIFREVAVLRQTHLEGLTVGCGLGGPTGRRV